MAKFENKDSLWLQALGSLSDQRRVKFSAALAGEEGDFRFVFTDFARKRVSLAQADVGRIGHDQVQDKRRARKAIEKIALDEKNLVGDAVAGGIAPGDVERGAGTSVA